MFSRNLKNIFLAFYFLLKIIIRFKTINTRIPYIFQPYKWRRKKWLFISKAIFRDDIKEISRVMPEIDFIDMKRPVLIKLSRLIIGNKLTDYDYQSKNKKDEINKLQLFKIYCLILNVLKFIFRFEGIITGAYYYVEQRELATACNKLKIDFYVLHKESITTEISRVARNIVFKNKSGAFTGTALSTYNYDEMSTLKKIDKNKNCVLKVTGSPRLDKLFRECDNNKRDIDVVFFWFGLNTYLPSFKGKLLWPEIKKCGFYTGEPWDWSGLQNEYFKAICELAKNKANLNIYLKAKQGFGLNEKQLKLLSNISNLKIITTGSAEGILLRAKVIVGFNSTVLFEGLAAKCKVITPRFKEAGLGLESKRLGTLNINDSIYEAFTPEDMIKQINKFINAYSKNKNVLTNNGEKLLKHYLGNSDGKSSIRVAKFIRELEITKKERL